LLEAPPVSGLRERLFQLFGAAFLEGLVPVEGGEGWAVVRGFVTRPERQGPARPQLRLFVNGRPVRDRSLHKAVGEAYRAAGAAEARPEGCLLVELPLHLVDVNVHPAKTEVRFAEPRTVFAAVQRAVREALQGSAPGVARAPGGRVAEAVERYLERATAGGGAPSQLGFEPLCRVDETGQGAVGAGSTGDLLPAGMPRVLGQHRNTYIVASDGEELLLVDQHTAHERVRFEGVLAALETRTVESQVLLTPFVGPLAPRLRPVLEANAESLAALGFDVEPFGGGSLTIRTVPALLGARDPGPALDALLSELLERESTSWTVSSARDRLAATLACHSAARAGDALSLEQMRAIVKDLLETRHPTLCPHGRPTLVRLPREELTRWFGRVGWRRQ
jgi:DNA mismatch repair protein MutL